MSLQDELKEELLRAAHTIALERDKATQEEVEHQLANVETYLLQKIDTAERDELKGQGPAMRSLLDELERRANVERDTRDGGRLPGMGREDQVAYWGERGQGSLDRHAQESAVEKALPAAREAAQERYAALRDTVQEAVQDILAGREPRLSALLERQADRAALAEILEHQNERQGRER